MGPTLLIGFELLAGGPIPKSHHSRHYLLYSERAGVVRAKEGRVCSGRSDALLSSAVFI